MKRAMKPCLIFLVLLIVAACSTEPTEYQAGDALIRDSGSRAYYPRFRIEFPEVTLEKQTKVTYHTENVPSGKYYLALIASINCEDITDHSEWSQMWDVMDHSNSVMTVTITSHDGSETTYSNRMAGKWYFGRFGHEFWFSAPPLKEVPLTGDITLLLSFSADSFPVEPVISGQQ